MEITFIRLRYYPFSYYHDVTVHFVPGILPEKYEIMFIRTTTLLSYVIIAKLQHHYLQDVSQSVSNKSVTIFSWAPGIDSAVVCKTSAQHKFRPKNEGGGG